MKRRRFIGSVAGSSVIFALCFQALEVKGSARALHYPAWQRLFFCGLAWQI